MRALFLDIDGVVLHGEALHTTGDRRHLPPEKVKLVNEVCHRGQAGIVVSSTWRGLSGCLDILAFAGLGPFHLDWRTRDSVGGEIRGEQIADWLSGHPEIEAYAIVDDDSDMLAEQWPHFVKTPFHTGIDREHVERLVSILNTPPQDQSS